MNNEIEYQEMPNPIQSDLESCIGDMSDAECLSILEEILDLEPVTA